MVQLVLTLRRHMANEVTREGSNLRSSYMYNVNITYTNMLAKSVYFESIELACLLVQVTVPQNTIQILASLCFLKLI